MTASLSLTAGVFVGLGANLPSELGSPLETLEEALRALVCAEVAVLRRSPWYESEPVPKSDQPWFINGVAELATSLAPSDLLARLHRIEADLGRVRRERWEARVVDLDLLDYRGMVHDGPAPVLPHPRVHERSFVLLPLRDLAPDWCDPVSGTTIETLIARLPADTGVVRAIG
ncbi:MAG: 2-amino-4-hydroxy-6-hydroxymethyldihydropteridine diphosphokinase [Rhodospirillaceae bacterium]|jgi:2-amino-4-hydroxy-6-hydroxymethyldihydropteridine diphosphokinase|nr:2-amino-4-hydroxy-6-hydroxymethyldihydropteridine diphosphokinase [Rhodospirillaceae bacterium]MBT6205416.1 2-amino-4-hydroxy-6-hydroxymethyldihydropteridine diphosphokinase [Rhodospirillaceae bacterium]MBT6509452.1 2-amino-4-hydroxy-6-hydroxymethyldihydropteridine diphosphokinase [Rhodospirillaceae bacterium]MBT7647113.1 2-amino-4-hydroxy-6-hydroxymethyldihydropteridine diphosphokinase [Rhodospirillaceae bacterium]